MQVWKAGPGAQPLLQSSGRTSCSYPWAPLQPTRPQPRGPTEASTAERHVAVGPDPQWLCSGSDRKASLFQQKKTRPNVGWSVVSCYSVKSVALMGPKVLLRGQPDNPVTACWVLLSNVLPSFYTATQKKEPHCSNQAWRRCVTIYIFFFLSFKKIFLVFLKKKKIQLSCRSGELVPEVLVGPSG